MNLREARLAASFNGFSEVTKWVKQKRELAAQTQALQAMAVDTPGGRIHVQWDQGASATPNAQLAFLPSSWPPRASTTHGSIVAP